MAFEILSETSNLVSPTVKLYARYNNQIVSITKKFWYIYKKELIKFNLIPTRILIRSFSNRLIEYPISAIRSFFQCINILINRFVSNNFRIYVWINIYKMQLWINNAIFMILSFITINFRYIFSSIFNLWKMLTNQLIK